MSLINKMLQDLDARGVAQGAQLPPDIRAAAVSESRLPRRQVVIAASALTVCAAVAGYLWLKWPAPPGATPVLAVAPVVKVAPAAAPANTAPAAAMPVAPVAQQPVRVVPTASAPTLVAPAEPSPSFAALSERTTAVSSTPATPRLPTPAAPRASANKVIPESVPFSAPVRERAPRLALPAETPRVDRSATPATLAPATGGREVTVPQRAENAYRQALAALDDGKVSTAYMALEQALKLNPRHDAARQSMVSLLIEDGRNDEAMQQLEQGLAADSAQPSLAMLLARMQIERGVSGVATLQRTLPAATGNADYHAFLAGALQREQRHREAIDQYAAALRLSPNHGVWLMGMGISLQAEKRLREATEAFTRARASGMLTPALDAFVERKLQQLSQ